ncbi:C6 transcription factor, putative [Cordyceps militaris CM01]|uniref:C6 transcription factor, putative n=1 Tax=Cordyceps militaris (strain CM01) TaxID=983644 RepID=G3J9D5_CORMM|nr:C6 transcription factor, putative [Cordyceps militaris CM01]EGX94114.1 C6 transcription factor, putative [Cordyceps militaris CM01]
MASRVSLSSTTRGTTTPNSCPCCSSSSRRRRRRSGSASSYSSSSSASHNNRSMSLRAGIMTVLVAGAAAATQQWRPPAPASTPTIPSWTNPEVDQPPSNHVRVPAPMTLTHFTRQLDLVRRDPDAVIEIRGTAVAASSDSASSSSASSASSASSSATPTSSSPSSSSTSSPLPLPFDDAPTSIFKSSSSTTGACPNFMKKLLDDATFKKCYPLSMMLRTSTSFFQASKSLVSIVRVLDATCAADVAQCDTFLTQAAKKMLDASNCKTEYDADQGQVTEAFNGLRAYKVLYAATCLQNPATQNYCFASAVTNVTNPSDIFFYSMPLGLPLPGGSTPSCGPCTTQTMAIFHAATSDRSQKISSTYRDAARQVNTICGPGFVNDTATSGAGRGVAPPDAVTTLATVLFATLLGLTAMAW